MDDGRLLGSESMRRRLAALADLPLNFDPAELGGPGWSVTDVRQALRPEQPGPPVEEGTFRIAQRLMRGYEFADPSIVRAYYDPALPLERREMVLELRALGVLRLFAGVRVVDVYERDDGGEHVWGWSYATLEGHVERGQMDWEVAKALATGAVEFRVHALSRAAHIANPFVRVGFHLLRRRERDAFLESTRRRMRTLSDLALDRGPGEVRDAAADLTARPTPGLEPVHDEIARRGQAR